MGLRQSWDRACLVMGRQRQRKGKGKGKGRGKGRGKAKAGTPPASAHGCVLRRNPDSFPLPSALAVRTDSLEVIKHVMSVCMAGQRRLQQQLQKASRAAPQWPQCSLAGSCKFLLLDERNIHTACRAAGQGQGVLNPQAAYCYSVWPRKLFP